MKNPFKPDRSAQDRDNPVVPNAVERPVEQVADRAAECDRAISRASRGGRPRRCRRSS